MSAAEHAGNPHYLPTAALVPADRRRTSSCCSTSGANSISRARCLPTSRWMGFTGAATVRSGTCDAFEAVAAARDAAIALVQQAVGRPGACAAGRSIAPRRSVLRERRLTDRASCTAPVTAWARSVHGTGVNMDDYETHDDRRLLPGTGFTIEPGVYFSDFGIRSEINMVVGARRCAGDRRPCNDELARTRVDGGIDVNPQDHAVLRPVDRRIVARRRHGHRVAARHDADLVGAVACRRRR